MRRARSAAKRGGPIGALRGIALDELPSPDSQRSEELLALDDALTRLAQLDERRARIVELRVFGGLEVEETAEVLSVSPRSVLRDWKLAKAWIQRDLTLRSRS